MTRLALALLAALVGCERGSPPENTPTESHDHDLDSGAIRVAVVDGLEAAARDPAVAQQLGLAAKLETPEVESAIERLLARTTKDPELDRIADEFFVTLQDSPAMRAALLEHARQNPEFVDSDLGALRETFIADVERRLTREELAELLEQQLRVAVRGSDVALAQAWLSAGGASAVAGEVIGRIDDPQFQAELSALLGREGLQSQLVRRFADKERAARLLLSIQPLSSDALVEILDHERTAALLAGALARALQDPAVRERCEELFALALAAEFDAPAFTRALARLLDEPALAREAQALTSAVAREPFARQVMTADIARIPDVGDVIRQTLE